jgi:general secretion pathway protein A
MYFQYFGVKKNPFGMTPDPAFLYLTPQHREALAGLTYAILGQKGFLVLTGDAGTGKTTLLARVLQYLPANRIQSSVILNPMLTSGEFLEMALLDFGIQDVPASKAQRLVKLQRLLTEADRQNRICALIVDEAHKLSPELLEEIRLLGNFEQSDHKLLQILFLGQEELADTLNRPELRQLKQRIAARFSISPLAAVQVEEYIRFRWTKAGGERPAPFTAEAFGAIAAYSKGFPRLVNAICDNALMLAFSESSAVAQTKHVQEAAADLDLLTAARRAPQAPGPQDPVPEPAGAVPLPPTALVRNLERYAEPRSRSFFSKWVSRLGLVS